MLIGIDPLLGPELLSMLRAMGHGDEIAVVDANYPAVTDARRLVRMDGIDAPRIVRAILSVMPLDDFVEDSAFRPAIQNDIDRIEPVMAELQDVVTAYAPQVRLKPVAGKPFYDRVRSAFGVVASGEARLYGNIILRKGVIRPTSG